LTLAATGVSISESMRRSACCCALTYDIDVLDLVPADLPAEELLALLQLYNPARYRSNRITGAVSAGHVVLVSESIARRAGLQKQELLPEAEFFSHVRRLKKFSPGRADIAIAPQLSAVTKKTFSHHATVRLMYGNKAPVLLPLQIALLVLLLLGLAVTPWAALLALLAFHAQPVITTLGTPLRPRDILSATLLRSITALWGAGAGIAAILKSRNSDPAMAQARTEYAALLAGGTERFFEPRSACCPLCGSSDLMLVMTAHEPVMHKPGAFSLDRCNWCGYIFQNPRLCRDGLAFYYRDLYDGLGSALTELILGSDDSVYRRRIMLFRRYCTPLRWLDVGGGNGYLCCVAKGIWPHTMCDGLDQSRGIEQAREYGWIDNGYRGQFSEQAELLAGRYDCISMIQYLEHTTEPAHELRAAHTALAEGGMLFIEVPNPDFPPGRLLGRFWFQWLQPQHLHFFSRAAMERLLRKCNFEPIAWHLNEAHIPIDFITAAVFFLRYLAPPAHYPWHVKKSRFYGMWRCIVFAAGSPLVFTGLLADLVLLPLTRILNISNNYTVVARRSSRPDDTAH
jgi:SAM-dependent methyltransferase